MALEVKNIRVKTGEYSFSFDFSLEDREAVAVLGPSGSGKTTLLNAISGLIPIEEGAIVLDNEDITSFPVYKRSIAYVFQDYALFEALSVKANIAFPLKIRKFSKANINSKVKELLSLVELDGFEKRIAGTLSGGEKQRVALARALASDPKLLLLDEPLSALDVSLRERMRDFLRDVHDKTGIMTLLVTHDRADADAICSRIIEI